MAHMDVEMQVMPPDQQAVVVLDTNILLGFLDIIQSFVCGAEQQQLPVLIVIPGIVIHELDVQKNRDGLAWFARRASTWLLKKVKERRSVKGQALDETCKPSGNWKTREQGEDGRTNDGLILDCCQYFSRVQQCRTFLCSKDKLLAVEAESVGIPTLFPDQSFSSRTIALAIFGPEASMLRFGNAPSYRGKSDDDGMDVDDDSAVTELVRPSHALDQLHLEVIEHFAALLQELAVNVAGPEAAKFGISDVTSRHAPGYTRKPMVLWVTTDSVEYLNSKRACGHGPPRVEVFLMRPHEGRGARRGQDWSRRDWEVGLGGLRKIGDLWGAEGIRESVGIVEGEMSRVFEQRMRPTGVGLLY